jgi:ketosteroid isomerase-like protein
MTNEEVAATVRHWIDSWNARDVEAVLTHFDDDVRFTSPKAATITGRPLVEGKPALRAYWRAALERITSLRFTLDTALWDESAKTLAIVYVAELNGQRARACEFLRMGSTARAIEGEAMYGAALEA